MGDLYNAIDALLSEHGITGYKMCNDLGLSRSFITELRKGRVKSMKAETAQKIADYFNVSVDYLLTGAQKENALTESSKSEIGFDDFTYAMQNESKGLTEEDKALLLSMARQLKTARDKKNGGTD
ncbi:helix-turn-helix transcriptional regulator [uncultured Oscillibacter sp.]|uniref:helix-turn-helix domain-containing protein n=1 Tax=uncultured Oscillibacter sp. TaxID=876091 RepID=UPI0025E0B574|nr:helix-turn-helix transcriptional regulator [uncultured Oscillibacter sp.]